MSLASLTVDILANDGATVHLSRDIAFGTITARHSPAIGYAVGARDSRST